jgi:hypothetical protein
VQDIPKGFLGLVIEINHGDADFVLRRVLRRMPRDKWKDMINDYPKRFVSCLVAAVIRDETEAIHTLIKFGANVNKEGTPEGTALMAACMRGQFEAVKILVRYGARIAYTIQDDDGRTLIRDGISLAHRFPEVQQWLLVGQYTSRKFLAPPHLQAFCGTTLSCVGGCHHQTRASLPGLLSTLQGPGFRSNSMWRTVFYFPMSPIVGVWEQRDAVYINSCQE